MPDSFCSMRERTAADTACGWTPPPSPDWMRRNLYRRIEAVTPILDPDLKRELSDMLSIQLSDKRKACFVDDHLRNRWKSARPQKEKVRAQYTFYEYLKG